MADAGDLYDEFGNYIGPELSESEEVRVCGRRLWARDCSGCCALKQRTGTICCLLLLCCSCLRWVLLHR